MDPQAGFLWQKKIHGGVGAEVDDRAGAHGEGMAEQRAAGDQGVVFPVFPAISAPVAAMAARVASSSVRAQEGDVQTVEPDELDHRAEARFHPFPGQGRPPLPPQGQQAGKPGGGAALLVPLPMIGDVDVPEGAASAPRALARASALSKEAL